MTTIQIDTLTYQVPTTWSELTTAQALHVYSLYIAATTSGSTYPAICMDLLKILTGITAQQLQHWHTRAGGVFMHQLHELTTTLAAPFFDSPDAYQTQLPPLAYTLTTCPYPQLSDATTTYHAPADALDNVTLLELATIFTLLEQYHATPSMPLAHQILATIYRPAMPHTRATRLTGYPLSDCRHPFTEHIPAPRTQYMQQLPASIQGLLLFWLLSCRQHIAQQFPNLFLSDRPAAEQHGNDYGWAGILIQLAGGIVHLPQVSASPWRDAFIYMSFLDDQAKLAAMRPTAPPKPRR